MNQGGFGGGYPPGGGNPPGGGYPPAGGQGQPQGQGYGQPQGNAPQQGGGYAQQPGQPAQPGYPGQQGAWGQQQDAWQQQQQQQQQPQQGGWGQQQPQGYGPPPGQQGYGAPPQQQGGWGQPQQGYGPPPGGGYGPPPGGGYGPPPGGGYGPPPGGGYGPALGMGPTGAETRFSFEGTGGELFGKLFVGFLLTGITFGIYGAWFAVGFINYLCEKTTISTPSGPMRVRFNGTGGDLFGTMFVGFLLTMITFGIYGPWFACKLARYFADNTQVQSSAGRVYQLRFTGEGGDLFGKALVNGLLMSITCYIYTPWAMCNMRKWYYQKTQIVEQGQPIGQLDFVGEGGDLFGTFIGGAVLTGITFGIYASWFKVALSKFFDQNTRIMVNGRTYSIDFTGTGGDLFVLNLVNGLLTVITFGIYWFWAKVKMLQWQYSNTVIRG
jgi:uncharacterized membrane protein YjgN (DUF898 family)